VKKNYEYMHGCALKQHVLRTQLQAMIWINVCVKALPLYDPGKLGWVREKDKWKPFWTDSPQAAKSYYELMKCGCKKGVSETANAVTQQKCMALCACGEDLDWCCRHTCHSL